MTNDLIITMNDVRRAKMCSQGARQFFSVHNLDWDKFLVDGLPAHVILATNDAMAERVVEVANGRRK